MSGRTLPHGFAVRLPETTRTLDGGRTLFGGSPARLLYLRPAAARLLRTGSLMVRDGRSAALARLLLDRGLADPVPPPRSSRQHEVTVVIPVRDRPHELARLLRGLPVGVPVVVVDDGSTDAGATAAVVAEAGAMLLRHPRSLGPAAARNTGLRAVRTPAVAFVDSDVVPCAGWLDTLLAHLADPAVGAVAPRIGALASSRGGPVVRYEAARSSLDLGPVPALVAPRGRVSYVPSACLVGRVEAFGAGFDESMHVAEDVDLVWRMLRAGWLVRYEPAARVDHEHRVAVRDWLQRKAFYGTGAAPLALRHGGAVAPVVASPWTVAIATGLLIQRRWSVSLGAALVAGATLRLSRKLEHSDHPARAAASLAPYGVVSALWQCGAAATRHWWPVAVPAMVLSRRARRAVLVAAVADGLADWRRTRPDLDPVRYVALRRLDDLAYGTGLWCGAVRHRTASPLLPSVVRSTAG